MNLPAILNIALGLVVLYFLLSTIASLLLELVTSWTRYREEILFVTINRLLTGRADNPWGLLRLSLDRVGQRLGESGIPGRLRQRLVYASVIHRQEQSPQTPDEAILRAFWQHPKIKSLTSLEADAPPSIEPAIFAGVMLDIALPRDPQGLMPENRLALQRALAQPGAMLPASLRETLRRLGDTSDIPLTATGEAFWAPYRAAVAGWFSEATKRSTERYRRNMQVFLLLGGFVLAALLNADTLRTAQLLWTDRALQEATAGFAEQLADSTKIEEGKSTPRTIEQQRAELSQNIEHLRDLEALGFPLGWRGADHGFSNPDLYRKARAEFAAYWQSDVLFDGVVVSAVWSFTLFALIKLAGLGATALAVAQGGPFWYDLMNRLIGLRKGQGDSAAATGGATSAATASSDGGKPTTTGTTELPLEIGHDLVAAGNAFDPRKAYWSARAACIAYAAEAEIRALVIDTWRFHELKFFNGIKTGTQGFCACDDRVVLLAFRGTELRETEDMVTDARIKLVAPTAVPGAALARVHTGFQDGLTDVEAQLKVSFHAWLGANPQRRIVITGHSLGGALATLCFAQIAATHASARPLLYTFGCPKVGNEVFALELDRQYPNQVFRLINETDIVPELPPLPAYSHAGQSIQFEPGGRVRTQISGLGRLLGYAAGVAKSFKQAGAKAVDDHGMNHYVARCEALVKPAPAA